MIGSPDGTPTGPGSTAVRVGTREDGASAGPRAILPVTRDMSLAAVDDRALCGIGVADRVAPQS